MTEPKVVPEIEGKDEPLKNDKMRLVVEVERIFDPERKMNNLMMTMGACSFDDGENEVGEVLHGVPAHSVIRDKETGEDWVLNYGVLFHAYKDARSNFGKGDEEVGEPDTPEDGVILDESGFSSGVGIPVNEKGEALRDEHMGLDDGEVFDKKK